MRVAEPRGHAETVRGLWRAAAEGRLPHAFCLEGPAGIGKFQAAQWLAAGLLCDHGPGPPCGACPGCRKTVSGGWRTNHADLFVLDAVAFGHSEYHPLQRVAYRPDDPNNPDPDYCLERFLPLKPLEGRWRLALVREAHRLQPPAQNGLLKMLEEPPRDAVLVLETERADQLLDTIRSRCVRVRLRPLEWAEVRAALEAEGLDGETAEELARWSGGSPGEGLRLGRQGAAEMRRLLVAVAAGEAQPLAAATGVWEVEGEFVGDTARRQARERARALLDLALALVGDALRHRGGAPVEALRHGDLGAELLGALAPDSGTAEERARALLLARRDVDANLAPEIAVDRALLDLAPPRTVRG